VPAVEEPSVHRPEPELELGRVQEQDELPAASLNFFFVLRRRRCGETGGEISNGRGHGQTLADRTSLVPSQGILKGEVSLYH
jgi:hypothetical protein